MTDQMPIEDPVWQTLNELRAACDESLRYYPGSEGWTRTGLLSGTRRDRSSWWLKKLIKLGYVEGHKPPSSGWGQWGWRITAAGRQYVTEHIPAAPPIDG